MGISKCQSLFFLLCLGGSGKRTPKGGQPIHLVAAAEATTPLGSCVAGRVIPEFPREPVKRAAEPGSMWAPTRSRSGPRGLLRKSPRQTQGGLRHQGEQPLVKLRKSCRESQQGWQWPDRRRISARWGLLSQPKKPTYQLTQKTPTRDQYMMHSTLQDSLASPPVFFLCFLHEYLYRINMCYNVTILLMKGRSIFIIPSIQNKFLASHLHTVYSGYKT